MEKSKNITQNSIFFPSCICSDMAFCSGKKKKKCCKKYKKGKRCKDCPND